MKLNENLFEQIYEVVNIRTGEVEDITLNDGVKGGKNTKVIPFFSKPRTIQDLRVELCRADIPLLYVLKNVEQLFYMVFDEEDYEIKNILDTEQSTQYIVIDKVQGLEIAFDIDNTKFDIFYVRADGIFFANKYATEMWHKFLNLLYETHWVIYDYEHEGE